MKKAFYIISTPIGNLEDVTFRAIETLKSVDLILCEDTRVTRRLLERYSISKPLLSYHQRSKLSRVETIIEHIQNGKTCGLVTDAGTPGISDPGNELIEKIIEVFGDEIKIVPIPGPSALTTLASVAGIDLSKFCFLGFPPHKKGRETFFKRVASSKEPIIYYESPHRFLKNLKLLQKMCQTSEIKKELIIGRELTKMFEEIKRGRPEELIEYYESGDGLIKGEFVVIVD